MDHPVAGSKGYSYTGRPNMVRLRFYQMDNKETADMSTTQSKTGSVRNLKQRGERSAQKAASSPVMEVLTRIGYGVRGLIYITMGILAVDVALGKGSGLAS